MNVEEGGRWLRISKRIGQIDPMCFPSIYAILSSMIAK